MPERRSSLAEDFQDLLIVDKEQTALQEARNGLLQFDEVIKLIEQNSSRERIELNRSLILNLQRLAVNRIRRSAGRFRTEGVQILYSSHEPPWHQRVPGLIDEMCAYLTRNWQTSRGQTKDALHLSAYAMWRLNWIHPFNDGNGRTSRALSYLILSIRLGKVLPGSPTIPDQIIQNKEAYYKALDAADAACRNEEMDISMMEILIERLLVEQFLSVKVDSLTMKNEVNNVTDSAIIISG